jgi:hypothetical protein
MAYAPLSPARDFRLESPGLKTITFRPESPGLKTDTFQPESPGRPSFIEKLIRDIKRPTKTRPPSQFVPIANFESYKRLSKLAGNPVRQDIIDAHEEAELSRPPKQEEEPPKVEVKVDPFKNEKWIALHEKYYSKSIIPPIEEYLEALESLGYPPEHVEKVRSKHVEPKYPGVPLPILVKEAIRIAKKAKPKSSQSSKPRPE